MNPARGLLLDIGGVVLEPGPTLVNRLAAQVPAVGELVAGWGGIAGPNDDDWQLMLEHKLSERDYWARRCEQIVPLLPADGCTDADADVGAGLDATRALMRRLFSGPSQQWLRSPTIELMKRVRAAGIPLGALTNDLVDFHGKAWVDAQEWVGWFDVVVDASLTGILKPDPRAYAAVAAALGLEPGQIVYLDDMPWNVDGGARAGLQAIQVDHADAGPAVAKAADLLGLN